jgi:hypothetical protein
MLGAAFEVLLTPVWKRVLCAIRTENRMFAKTRSGQTLKRKHVSAGLAGGGEGEATGNRGVQVGVVAGRGGRALWPPALGSVAYLGAILRTEIRPRNKVRKGAPSPCLHENAFDCSTQFVSILI